MLIIVNPSAGHGRAGKQLPLIKEELKKADISYTIVFSERGWHCAELAKAAIEAGERTIISVGGDGTGHEVINGICNQNVADTRDITFGIIPVGTGNDWIKTHQIPNNISKAIQIIKNGKTATHDIGLALFKNDKNERQQRYFFNVAGMAYDGHVTRVSNLERSKITSSIQYYLLIFKCLFQFQPKRARLILDDKEVSDKKFYTINVGICRYSGGGMQFVPHAKSNDGQFAVSSVDAMSKLGVMLSTHYLYGRIAKHPKGAIYNAKSVKVEASNDEDTLLELDGEYVGKTPVEFQILPQAIKVFVP